MFCLSRLSREMNNKKISCVAKNNEINAPKTRTVTVQMNCKSGGIYQNKDMENSVKQRCQRQYVFFLMLLKVECRDRYKGDSPLIFLT